MKGQSWKKKVMQILCLLSVLVLFISAQDFVMLAEAVSENDVRMEPGTTANPIHHCTKKDDGSCHNSLYRPCYGHSGSRGRDRHGCMDK